MKNSNMNKKITAVIVVLLLVLGGGYWLRLKSTVNENTVKTAGNISKSQSPTPKPKGITVSIELGEKNSTISGINAEDAYAALQQATVNANLNLKTKKYSFGIFIEEIAGLKNTKDKSWIYYVNGKSATQAADVQRVEDGDLLEWKYEKPIY
jgi:hypothetical protein